jgi:hypothetical protein
MLVDRLELSASVARPVRERAAPVGRRAVADALLDPSSSAPIRESVDGELAALARDQTARLGDGMAQGSPEDGSHGRRSPCLLP